MRKIDLALLLVILPLMVSTTQSCKTYKFKCCSECDFIRTYYELPSHTNYTKSMIQLNFRDSVYVRSDEWTDFEMGFFKQRKDTLFLTDNVRLSINKNRKWMVDSTEYNFDIISHTLVFEGKYLVEINKFQFDLRPDLPVQSNIVFYGEVECK